MSTTEAQRHWDAIVSIATLGTDRAPLPELSRGPAPELIDSQVAPERQLLRATALSQLWLLAGTRQAIMASPDVEAPARKGERHIGESAAWRLGRMLAGEHRELVSQWLEIAAGTNAVLPPHWLPTVLMMLKENERVHARALLGATGAWLARFNPEWNFATAHGTPSEEQWELGSLQERAAALRAMYESQPDQARTWLERTWKTDPPDARAAFVAVLAASPALSGKDEPFLEAALDDKRKEVRRAAAAALRRLPGSAFERRNIERLSTLLVLEPGTGLLSKLRGRRLEVKLPESLLKAAARDGIEPSPPQQRKIGERAYWLMQMIAAVRPSHWTERFGCDVQTFLGAVRGSDYAVDLLLALAQAASVHPDSVWAIELSQRLIAIEWGDGPSELSARVHAAIHELITTAPAQSRLTLVKQLAQEAPDARLSIVITAYEAAGHCWDETVTRRFFSQLAREVQSSAARPWGLNHADWGRLAHVATAAPILDHMLAGGAADSPWRRPLETLRETLQFRAHMQQELLK
jgi:hypothetical protein